MLQAQMDTKSSIYFFLVLFAAFVASNAESLSISHTFSNPELPRFLLAGALSAISAAIANAGGIGGGGLFVPILAIVAGVDVRTAMTFSAFMVTGGSMAKIVCYAASKNTKARIDYDIVLLSEPALLLGVSGGVILNRVLPEWVITAFFAVFIGFCTLKTFKSGVSYWRRESQGMMSGESTRKPLLREEAGEGKLGIPWKKLGMLVAIWLSFFLLYLFRGNSYGKVGRAMGIMKNKNGCGKAYWIISVMQIPIAILFSSWILFSSNNPSTHHHQENGGLTTEHTSSSRRFKLIFPVMALLAGLLGGVFGIGGGMVITPLLLQIGIEPQVTAVTSSFIVLFSSTMSSMQHALLGMEGIHSALALAAACFVASVVGSTLVQGAVVKWGRPSVIVFVIGTVMGLSTIVMTSFGAMETWRDYKSGKSMGFNNPC